MRILSCLFTAFLLGACNDQASEMGHSIFLEYQIVGGKSGALVETTTLNCTSNTLSLMRRSQKGDLLIEHHAELDSNQCKQVRSFAENVCQDFSGVEKGVYDAASYRLTCNLNEEVRHMQWQGSWSKSPKGLRDFHEYTRQLLSKALGEELFYP
ncbi:hypothetical protein L4C38_15425 [Vibrio kasasachensis]|uniref:hypothetical protein n=1 Tax=Vibrio kasasachensis TaxID=2910248 RepID=UPI003D104E9D